MFHELGCVQNIISKCDHLAAGIHSPSPWWAHDKFMMGPWLAKSQRISRTAKIQDYWLLNSSNSIWKPVQYNAVRRSFLQIMLLFLCMSFSQQYLLKTGQFYVIFGILKAFNNTNMDSVQGRNVLDCKIWSPNTQTSLQG